ncbi:hypothetical protein V5P93_000599 [Actinokineospora auranticolor]|uniref:Uncharacterized protein n=1 Tax=Actinokineospora auranticolor TaxID=155976 RepID=A0A2S6GZD2_9PSEU|nr:hypothetical protein [Actinokineospora auranticolor]PPK70521.1 hypothetical protein CLV40_102436 [Actinokineospora auranticolor]
MTAQTHRDLPMRVAFLLFGLGLLAVVAIFTLSLFDRHASWLWAVSMALPAGLVLGVVRLVRNR